MKPLEPTPFDDFILLIFTFFIFVLSLLLIATNPNAFLLAAASVIRYGYSRVLFELRS